MLSLIPNHYPESQNINCYIMCYVETSPWDRFLPVVGRKTLGRFSVLPSCQDSKVLYVQWSGTTQNIPCTIRNSLLHLVSPATENKSLRALLCNPLGQLTTGAGGGGMEFWNLVCATYKPVLGTFQSRRELFSKFSGSCHVPSTSMVLGVGSQHRALELQRRAV